MKCLSCQAEMMNHLVRSRDAELAYDLCESCGGLWLDKGELDKMAFQVEGSIEFCSRKPVTDVDEPPAKCPRCEGKTLDRVRFIQYGDVVLDRCANCGGFWLNAKEIDLINKDLENIMPVLGRGFSDFLANAHVPYWSKRIRRTSSETDFTIEAPPIPGAELRAETDYDCPTCPAKLHQYRAFNIEFEGCRQCKGLFLDPGELRKLKDRIGAGSWQTLRWMDDEIEAIEGATMVASDRPCPKCAPAKLLTTSFGQSGVLIDYCPTCRGVWLDQDEYRLIVGFLRQKLECLSAKDAGRKLRREIKEIWTGPEGKLSEVLDAAAALNALMHITIFEHPKLARLLLGFSQVVQGSGLG